MVGPGLVVGSSRSTQGTCSLQEATDLPDTPTAYPLGVQKYRPTHFTDLEGILNFFNLDYIEAGFVQVNRADDPDSHGTYFVAKEFLKALAEGVTDYTRLANSSSTWSSWHK